MLGPLRASSLPSRDRLSVYVNQNPNFRMPRDPATPLIMVGAGTGVAPFRAFLEEREETGAQGKTWLFFGDRRFRTDFLYQLDWLRWRNRGTLARMDVAFSRDTSAKVYVQHRMLERSRDIYAWLQEGACFFVCGDEKRLAPDVHAALTTIVRQEGHMSEDQARRISPNCVGRIATSATCIERCAVSERPRALSFPPARP